METLLGASLSAACLVALAIAVVAIHAEGRIRKSGARHARVAHGISWMHVVLGALFVPSSTHAQELNAVAQQYLQRHGVPCPLVVRVDNTADLDEIATCQDGRDWALFWLEDEIAFVHPQTHALYKWDRELYASHPEVFFGTSRGNETKTLTVSGGAGAGHVFP